MLYLAFEKSDQIGFNWMIKVNFYINSRWKIILKTKYAPGITKARHITTKQVLKNVLYIDIKNVPKNHVLSVPANDNIPDTKCCTAKVLNIYTECAKNMYTLP